MTKLSKLIITIVILFAIIPIYSQWHNELVESYSSNPSIALNSSDQPHILYYSAGDFRMKHAHYDGSTWHYEIPDNSSVNGIFKVVKIDDLGNLHVAYQDDTNRTLRYAFYDGSTWQTELVEDTGLYDGNMISMALDASGNPHITHFDSGAANFDLLYVYYDGSSWQYEEVDTTCNSYRYSSIAIDSDGKAHISHTDDYPGFELRYAVFDGTTWTYETVDDYGDIQYYNSIDLDSSEHPHIAYFESGAEDLRYAYFDGSVWHTETVDSYDRVGMYLSMVLDDNDNPHISYYDNTNDRLKYAYHNGSEWIIEVVDESEVDVGWSTSIALDSSGAPHIACGIAYLEGVKYAYLQNGANTEDISIGSDSFLTNYPNPFDHQTNIRFELPKTSSVTLTIYDSIGRIVDVIVKGEVMNSGMHTLNWTGCDKNGHKIPSGVYTCSLETDDFIQSKRMVLIK
ncbi:MAG: FlgD immunoglobulin-like domain containing protein [Bacteroidota bacterium]